MGLILLIILILLLLGAFPREGAYNANWGYYPGGLIGVLLLILIIILIMDAVPFHRF